MLHDNINQKLIHSLLLLFNFLRFICTIEFNLNFLFKSFPSSFHKPHSTLLSLDLWNRLATVMLAVTLLCCGERQRLILLPSIEHGSGLQQIASSSPLHWSSNFHSDSQQICPISASKPTWMILLLPLWDSFLHVTSITYANPLLWIRHLLYDREFWWPEKDKIDPVVFWLYATLFDFNSCSEWSC